MSEQERWGIHVDGIALFDFNSGKEAKEYRENCLQNKDAVVFPCQKNVQENEDEDYYTPGHA